MSRCRRVRNCTDFNITKNSPDCRTSLLGSGAKRAAASAFKARMLLVLYHILKAVRKNTQDTVLVTGGAGFIGSNFVLTWLGATGSSVINLDLLTYAGNPANLASLEADPRYQFVRGDICDAELVGSILEKHRPRAIVHFAAESHVDRSIASPEAFIRTNVQGTFVLLEQARNYWSGLDEADRAAISLPARFHRRGLRFAGEG